MAPGVGFGVELGSWTLDAMGGYSVDTARDVDADEALVIPGKYESGGGIVMLGMTRRL